MFSYIAFGAYLLIGVLIAVLMIADDPYVLKDRRALFTLVPFCLLWPLPVVATLIGAVILLRRKRPDR